MKETKGGYAPTENTPFGLFRKEVGKEKPVVSKKEKTAAKKSDDEVYIEKVAPGVEVPVPGLTKEGKLKKKSDRVQEAKGKVKEYVRAGDSEANAMVRVIDEMNLTEWEEAQLWEAGTIAKKKSSTRI